MFDANREHKDTLTRMEQKFFEEKVWYMSLFFLKHINALYSPFNSIFGVVLSLLNSD